MCFKITLAKLCFVFFLQTSVAAAKTQRGLCLAQYCIFMILSCRSPELYPQNCYLVSYIVCLLLSILEIWDMASLWLSLSCK